MTGNAYNFRSEAFVPLVESLCYSQFVLICEYRVPRAGVDLRCNAKTPQLARDRERHYRPPGEPSAAQGSSNGPARWLLWLGGDPNGISLAVQQQCFVSLLDEF